MYLEHFGLKEFPFRLTPDLDFLYMSSAHARAKAYMEYTVANREGFVVITGEIGCGKTTLIQKLLSELDENVVVAKIFQTQLDEVEFLQALLVEFGFNPFHSKKVELLDMLNTFLIEQFMERKQIVLVVDDAHNLSLKVLEEIRMLSGLETRKEKILHTILVGQPPLNQLLELPEMEQLLQRVRLRYHLKPLSEHDLRDYVQHRLRVAGAADDALFARDTFAVVHEYTGGIPRLINTLCDMALTVAYADSVPTVTAEVMKAAVQELQWPLYARRGAKQRGGRQARALDPGLSNALREQIHGLARITSQLEKLDDLGPALVSINSSLAAIELYLRRLIQPPSDDPLVGVERRRDTN
jgi:type II secretory pathway predicted ATPase ExeA